jgi:HK97 family phage portal protein
MGIFDRFRHKPEIREAPGTVPYVSGSSDSQFNFPWNSINPTSEACIRKIVSTIAPLKIDLFAHRKGGGRALMFAHSLALALKNPDPNITPLQFYSGLVDDIMRGNAYIRYYKISGQIVFEKLHRDDVQLSVENGKKIFAYGGQTLTEKEVLHIPYPFDLVKIGPYNVYKGRGPADKYSDLIALDNALNAYIKMYFANSPGKRAYLEVDKDSKLAGKDINVAYAELLPLLQKYVSGAGNAGRLMIPPPGTKLGTLDATQNLYADIKSLKELIERQIAQGHGVQYSLISETNKYNSLEANELQFLADTIEPLGSHIEQSFNRLLSPSETALYCKYDYKAMLRSDIKTTVDYLSKEIASGLLTVNEGRDALDLEAVEAGDQIFVPANMYPLTKDNVDAFFAQSKLASHNSAGDDKQ